MHMNSKTLDDLFKKANQSTGEPNRNIVEAIQREIFAGNANYSKDADKETIQVTVCLSHHPDATDFIEAEKIFEEIGAELKISSDPYVTINMNESDHKKRWVYRLACTISRNIINTKKDNYTLLSLEGDCYWIDHSEYGDMLVYNENLDVFFRLKTLDDMKKVLELIAKHGCYVTTFSYLSSTGAFYIEIKKKES